ncbi:amidohydrolase family protein [Bacillus sp. FJAT-49736]|uniref:amidohydrolase family protein n=1 Tax=Bacillus sp. FJAT-49736 TaxID=2833582 RepID=UPI001BCA0216|nr:amidohydrolase family protein [Bacillus sp. FJAT-49736]MBS4174991.1 amidohydrolase family protein [Bacillus sp. FJAT-49736]
MKLIGLKGALVISLSVCLLFGCESNKPVSKPADKKEKITIKISVLTDYEPDNKMSEKVKKMRKNKKTGEPLYEVYKNLPLIDVHNHQASEFPTSTYEQLGVDKTVLFGNISEYAAIHTDQLAWDDYKQRPDLVYPSFAGVNIYSKDGIKYAKDNLEKGYLAIGELAAASTYSPVVSNLEWKGEDPTSGNLGEIYNLAAKYKVPVLLHIDPPGGAPIEGLKRALTEHPHTNIIFGHANVANTPERIEDLLKNYDNLYIDFFAGYTEYDESSSYKIKDFIPLIEKYPNKFLFGTDGGFGIGYDNAINAIYETIDQLSPETAVKVAYQNYERLIETQPPTKTQIGNIQKYASEIRTKETLKLNKRMANELLFKLQEKKTK